MKEWGQVEPVSQDGAERKEATDAVGLSQRVCDGPEDPRYREGGELGVPNPEGRMRVECHLCGKTRRACSRDPAVARWGHGLPKYCIQLSWSGSMEMRTEWRGLAPTLRKVSF